MILACAERGPVAPSKAGTAEPPQPRPAVPIGLRRLLRAAGAMTNVCYIH